MSEILLRNRDYTVILARNPADDGFAPPGLKQKWLAAQDAIVALAAQCEAFNPDGIAIYIASQPFKKYDSATSDMLVQLFKECSPTAPSDLAASLNAALENYFSRKASGHTKENGEIIIAILDREPRERMTIVKGLVEATRKMETPEELGVMFAQVGDDLMAKGFLTALDDDLEMAGACFNIADTTVLTEVEPDKISEFLLNALYG